MGKRGMRKATGMTQEQRIEAAKKRQAKEREERHERNVAAAKVITKAIIEAAKEKMSEMQGKPVQEPTGLPECICLECENIILCEHSEEHCRITDCRKCDKVRKTCEGFKQEE